jgi:hypothetical protein
MSRADVEAACEDHPDGNIGIRLRRGAIGVDADLYKPGAAQAWAGLVSRLGALPDGPMSTSRDDGSGIHWLRVPEDYEAVGSLPGDCGEVVQWFHRYVVVPPSIHPDTGKPYRWVNVPGGHIPTLDDLPLLPQAWLDELGARPASNNGHLPFQQPGPAHQSGWTNPDVDALAVDGMKTGTQHDQMRDLVAQLVGKGMSRPAVQAVWWATVSKTTLHEPERWTQHYFDAMYNTAAAKYGTEQPAGGTEDAGEAGDLAEIAAAFTPLDWHAAWNEQPEEIQWLIEPLIEAGQSVALYATPGTGKSLIALELAAALAAGRCVLGNPAREPITVVYVDVENRQRSLVERLQAFGYKPADLGRLVLFSFPSIAALDSLLGGQQIFALAVTHKAAIVIIDTTSRVVAGKENDADTYLALYRHTVIPLRARGIAMLRLDHPGKDVSRGTRGSSAKKGDVDAEWLLTKLSENTFGLDRQKERENHGDRHIGVRRHAEPLRHEVTSGSGDRAQLAAELDRLNVPPGTGRVIAGKALRDAGIKARGTDLAEALKRRNAVPSQPTLDDGPSGSQTVGTARNRSPDSDPAGDGSHHPHIGGNREPSPAPEPAP